MATRDRILRTLMPLALLSIAGTTAPGCASEEPKADASDEQDVTGTAVASKDKLWDGDFYYVRITSWDASKMTPAALKDETTTAGSEMSMFVGDAKSGAHCPDAETSDAKLVYKTKKFSLRTSGNLTNGTPKSSYKISLEQKDDRLFEMKAINLKSMWNDVSQMREALAWKMFREAGVHAPRHTYAKLCVNGKYFGLYSMIEQVEKTFLADHFGENKKGNLYKAYWPERDLGPAELSYRKGADGDDSGKQYKKEANVDDRTYQLKTNDSSDDPPAAQTYDDLALFTKAIAGIGLAGSGDAKFDTAEYAAAMEKIFDVKGFLRWAGVNVMLGAWDNYWGTPANYYVYNAGPKSAPKDFMTKPYFTWIPWDYDNTFGSDFFGTKWQYTSIVDFETSTKAYNGGRKTTNLPLLHNLLKNTKFLRYYLDHLEWFTHNVFDERWVTKAIGDEARGFRSRVQTAAYLESDSPNGAPHTGRQYTNDEVFRHGFNHDELHKGSLNLEGVLHYVRMRHEHAERELGELRRTHPRGSSGATFPARPESIP